MAEQSSSDSAQARLVSDETAPRPSAVEFLLDFTRAGQRAGYPTADLEERVLALAEALGLTGAQVSATPTLVDVSLGSLTQQRSYSFRVRPPAVDLDAIARLDALVQDVLDRRRDPDSALAALTHIETNPLNRPWPVLLAAYALAGAAVAPVLGGGWPEALGAAIVGLVVAAVVLPARRTVRTEAMVAPLAAVAASFSAAAFAELGSGVAPDIVTLAALITLLPGMTLTIGMRELSTEHLQSGVANTASALVQLLGLVFGVGIGRSIAASWFGASGAAAAHMTFTGVDFVSAVAAGLAFTLTLRARYRDAAFMCAATLLAVGANKLGSAAFGDRAAVFVAALAVGVAGGLVGSAFRRSPLVFIVPGVLMLVPGSAGFNSVLQLLTNQTVSGINAAFDTFVTAISIAYGLMVSTVILPRRFTQLKPSDTPATRAEA